MLPFTHQTTDNPNCPHMTQAARRKENMNCSNTLLQFIVAVTELIPFAADQCRVVGTKCGYNEGVPQGTDPGLSLRSSRHRVRCIKNEFG